MRKLKFNKWGLTENPRNLLCTLRIKDRTYLGEIRDAEYNHVLGVTQLTVRHFNGELWPLKPSALAVDILQ